MNIDLTRPVDDLRKSALFEATRPAPEDGDGTSWSFQAHEDYGPDGFWNFWEVGTCDGDVGTICKFCHEELHEEEFTEDDRKELARLEVRFENAGGRGVEIAERIDKLRSRRDHRWVDDTDGDTCSGDDDGNNENEPHVLFDNENGHPTDVHGTCQLEACPDYGSRAANVEGPMMNYWYPIGDRYGFDPDDAALALKDLPLCVVEVSGDMGLALTGGGMDFTWEIVEAFVTLGYLPPLAHNDPPQMAGKELASEKNQYLLAACRESITFAIQRLTWDLERFDGKWNRT